MTTLPGPTVGVVGGGQLGRMLGEAASPLGVDLVVLDPTPDCPANRVADQIVGEFDDPVAVAELAERTDVLTYEIELADPGSLLDAGVPVHPAPETLRVTGDKLVEKQTAADAGVPTAAFRRVDDADDLASAVGELGEVMLKARTGGYDGRGNLPVAPGDDYEAALDAVAPDEDWRREDAGGADALAEGMVDFERELAVIGVRGAGGERALFPVTETIHREEILRTTTAPPRTDDAVVDRARSVALDVLDLVEGRGVVGIELFETDTGDVLFNEAAPRPHNSGHWTIEGARTSQFEQHLRAVLGWPLGATRRRCPTATANLLGDVDDPRPARLSGVDRVLDAPGAHLHWYGKREARPLRKMGHLTVTGGENGGVAPLERARDLAAEATFDEGAGE
ncbi:MAG: 5-(carboxyamino)imidazole ribonucleotide synthase [Haloferacaceae archaeon]